MLTVFWKGYKMVHFVGAGSGAADLITIRGKKLLENADIIIYAVRLLILNFWNMQKTVLKFITVRK